MTCKKCGELLEENAKFCPACGASVAAEGAVINPVHQRADDCVHEGHVVGSTKPVGFVQAVISAFTHYADFKGRARRSEYWWFTLFNILVSPVIGAIAPEIAWLWTLAVPVPGTALVVRRLHDTGKRGWFYLWILVPLAGYIIMLLQLLKDSDSDNRWGYNPKL